MNDKIKLNYDSTAIDALNAKIEGAKNAIEETAEEIENIKEEIDETIKEVANENATVEDVKALQSKLHDLELTNEVNATMLQGFEKAKREDSADYVEDMHEAHKKAFDKLQVEYNKAYTEVLIPARKAFIEALAHLGSINQNAKSVNGEFQREYNKTNEKEKREAFRFNRSLQRKEIYTSNFYTGKNESQGFGISEYVQEKIHDSGM